MQEENSNAPDWWDELSEQQKAHIQEGLEDTRSGRTMSSEEFWKRLKSIN
jgi:predicted transcriptional regulator